MRTILQRVKSCSVAVDGEITGAINGGLLVFLGIAPQDGKRERDWMIDKIINLRIFADDDGKMNLSLLDTGGALLVVSQFTLYGDCRRGRRPGYSQAAPPDIAEPLYEDFVAAMRKRGVTVETGTFGADMDVSLINDGPVTLLLDSEKKQQ